MALNKFIFQTASCILLAVIVGINCQSVFSQNNKETNKKVNAVFVAYNWLYIFQTPTSPSQYFVVDIAPKGGEKPILVKLIYFPDPSSVRGGVNYLKVKPGLYLKSGNIIISPPDSKQSEQCEFFDNFLKREEKNEYPQMMFQSFKYESFMTFEFDKMECYVLVSDPDPRS